MPFKIKALKEKPKELLPPQLRDKLPKEHWQAILKS